MTLLLATSPVPHETSAVSHSTGGGLRVQADIEGLQNVAAPLRQGEKRWDDAPNQVCRAREEVRNKGGKRQNSQQNKPRYADGGGRRRAKALSFQQGAGGRKHERQHRCSGENPRDLRQRFPLLKRIKNQN